MSKLTNDEINSIYCCISFAQDLRDAFDEGLVEEKGWGKYNYSTIAYNTSTDINRVLEAEQSLMNEIYGYNFRKIVTKEFHKPLVKDPARPRVNKYYDR